MKLFFVMITFVLGTSYSFFNEEQIVLIDEKKLIHGDFSICDKLNKNYFNSHGFAHSRWRWVKPSFDKIGEEYNNFDGGLSYSFDDGILSTITICFPRKDTTLRGISVGCTQYEVETAYGPPSWNAGARLIGYENIGFLISDSLVYGIFIYDENDCED